VSVSHRSNRVIRAAVVTPVIGALLYWIAVQYLSTASLALWREDVLRDEETRQDRYLREPLEMIPSDPSHLVDYGTFWSDEAFPQDYDLAKQAATKAILAAPMHSEAWLLLARVLFFERSKEAATLALSRSDSLSPVYTFERFASLELHELLGDRERVLSVARSIARTHPANAAKTAELLRSIGVPPAEAFDALEVADHDSEAIARVLESLATTDAGQMTALLAKVPEQKLASDPVLARACLRLAVAASAYDSLLPLWSALTGQDPEPVPGGSGLTMVDPGMQQDPSAKRSPLGWQLRDEERRWRAAWRPGVLRLEYLSALNEDDRISRTTLLQAPVGKMPPTRWSIRINSNEPLRSRVSLSVRANGESHESPMTSLSTEGATTVSVDVPAIDGATMVSVTLVRSREGSARQAGVLVEVSDLNVALVEEEAP